MRGRERKRERERQAQTQRERRVERYIGIQREIWRENGER